MNLPEETERGIYMPVQVYPMFETALRAAAGRTVDEHERHLGKLWSDLSHVAAGNEYAWIRDAKSPEEITTVTREQPDDRLPYPKYMNSNNDVDMGAAIIMCSVEAARRLGVPEDRWVFPHSGTDCHEHKFVSHRDTFARTPAIELGGRRALELAGVGIDDIAIIDLYSCFPAAVQLGAASLGIDLVAPVVTHRRPAVRRRPVEQLRDARDRLVVTTCASSRANTGWSGRTAATRPSTRSACTPPSRRPTGFRHDQATGRDRPTPRAASWRCPADAAGAGDDRGVHRDVLPRRRARAAARLVSARRRSSGVGFVHRRRHRRRRCATANGSAPPSPSTADGTLHLD